MEDTGRSRLRRQRSLSPLRELRTSSPGPQPAKPSRLAAIGSFFIPSVFKFRVHNKSDVAAKRKFQVKVPTRLLEAHMNDNKSKPHYHSEKFVNVDTKQAMAHFLGNRTASSTDEKDGDDEPPLLESSSVANDARQSNSTKTKLRHSTRHSFHNSTKPRSGDG
eukprot:scaffold860_cov111-Cylindrotheca_fusiformis.AAC.4